MPGDDLAHVGVELVLGGREWSGVETHRNCSREVTGAQTSAVSFKSGAEQINCRAAMSAEKIGREKTLTTVTFQRKMLRWLKMVWLCVHRVSAVYWSIRQLQVHCFGARKPTNAEEAQCVSIALRISNATAA
jgi:hypothetical protein